MNNDALIRAFQENIAKSGLGLTPIARLERVLLELIERIERLERKALTAEGGDE